MPLGCSFKNKISLQGDEKRYKKKVGTVGSGGGGGVDLFF